MAVLMDHRRNRQCGQRCPRAGKQRQKSTAKPCGDQKCEIVLHLTDAACLPAVAEDISGHCRRKFALSFVDAPSIPCTPNPICSSHEDTETRTSPQSSDKKQGEGLFLAIPGSGGGLETKTDLSPKAGLPGHISCFEGQYPTLAVIQTAGRLIRLPGGSNVTGRGLLTPSCVGIVADG